MFHVFPERLTTTEQPQQKGWGSAVTTFYRAHSPTELFFPYLQETVISTLVAGMLPVNGSKSYTEDMSSSLSITSPSIISIVRPRSGSGLIREAHSLTPPERVESPVSPQTRSETRRSPVRAGEAATAQMVKLKKTGERGGKELGHWVRNPRRERNGSALV